MRQGQQNCRGRGRGRKPQNPLARSYELNGPDVKIRGTAAHIAEKYMSLARDSLASGDMVAAESYLQHAEHYNRIIMAAQTQFGTQQGGQQSDGPNGGSYRNPRWNSEGSDDDGDGGARFRYPTAAAAICATRGGQERQRRRAPGWRRARAARIASAMPATASTTAAAVTSRTATAAMAARPDAIARRTAPTNPSPTRADETAPDQVS